MKIKKVFFTTIIFLALFPFASEAQLNFDRYKQFVEISATDIIFAGSYDGKSYFATNDEVILVPKIKPGIGLGIDYGFVIGDHASINFAYRFNTSDYTTMYEDITGKSTIHVVHLLDLKFYFIKFAEKRIKFYYNFDWSLTFCHFNKIAFDNNVPGNFVNLRSANFSGMAFGSGFGMQCMLSRNLAIDLRVLPEFQFVTDLKTKSKERHEVAKFNNLMLINTFGLKYYFKER